MTFSLSRAASVLSGRVALFKARRADTMPTNKSAEETCRLLKLAPELRNMVYELVLAPHCGRIHFFSSVRSTQARFPQFLYTCTQVFLEAGPMWLSDTVLTFSHLSKLLDFLWTLPLQHRRTVRGMRLFARPVCSRDYALFRVCLDEWGVSRHMLGLASRVLT